MCWFTEHCEGIPAVLEARAVQVLGTHDANGLPRLVRFNLGGRDAGELGTLVRDWRQHCASGEVHDNDEA